MTLLKKFLTYQHFLNNFSDANKAPFPNSLDDKEFTTANRNDLFINSREVM